MPSLDLRPNHQPVRDYYKTIDQLSLLSATHEGAVSEAFATLLRQCGKKLKWTLVPQFEFRRLSQAPLRIDGALLDPWSIVHGYWEAKDEKDDLPVEVKKKIASGYPTDNIIFQAPTRAILYQQSKRVADEDISKPQALVEVVKEFFGYQRPAIGQWERAVEEFREKVPQFATALLGLIDTERKKNPFFVKSLARFVEVCRQSLNPALSEVAVEKMLVQHILTERIFRKVFDNPDFVKRNVIASEVENVIDALTQRTWNRDKFLAGLNPFYGAIEKTAATIEDFSEKQSFLNTVYERFFQSFDAKTADTHGIVYTPQPIVRFMINSVDEVLQREFKSSLGDKGVHILDPFVGTGNFLLSAMRHIPKSRLPQKYAEELHANEVMLLPYYIASMNIEHEYAALAGEYRPFEGLCLVDTFELQESAQTTFAVMTEQNTERIARQKKSPITVIIGNPPYNAWQVSENDGNKNRRYEVVDARVSETYSRGSNATLVNSLGDPYIKAFRWASDRLGDEGVLAYVTNNGFLDGVATDGMRQCLADEFSAIYHFDLKGNARTTAERRRKEGGSVFNDQVRVGVGITILVKKKDGSHPADIHLYRTADYGSAEDKLGELESFGTCGKVPWVAVKPDERGTWITEGLRPEFPSLMPLAGAVNGIFKSICNGLQSNNDPFVFGFDPGAVAKRASTMVEAYNDELTRWTAKGGPKNVDAFLRIDKSVLPWVRKTKKHLARGTKAKFSARSIVPALYRPFTKQSLFFDRMFNEDVYSLPDMFSGEVPGQRAIVLTGVGMRSPFAALVTDVVPERHLCASTDAYQVVPLLRLEAGQPSENVTNWALAEFRQRYDDQKITKRAIFHYVYAVLNHPDYRGRYEANLKRELPRIPCAPDFWTFAKAGEKLAALHLEYEKQREYPLKRIENPDIPLDWRVEKMRLSRDKGSLTYNEFLTLTGIPSEVFEYRLGNRSALEWLLDQYQVSTDAKSGVVNDPNRIDDPEYIVRLIGRVITVSIETMKIVNALPSVDNSKVRAKARPH